MAVIDCSISTQTSVLLALLRVASKTSFATVKPPIYVGKSDNTDIWGKSGMQVPSNYSVSSLKRIKFRKPRQRKLRGYMAIGAGVLIIAISVVVVVALAVHFTSKKHIEDDLEALNQFSGSNNKDDKDDIVMKPTRKVSEVTRKPSSRPPLTTTTSNVPKAPPSMSLETSQFFYSSSDASSNFVSSEPSVYETWTSANHVATQQTLLPSTLFTQSYFADSSSLSDKHSIDTETHHLWWTSSLATTMHFENNSSTSYEESQSVFSSISPTPSISSSSLFIRPLSSLSSLLTTPTPSSSYILHSSSYWFTHTVNDVPTTQPTPIMLFTSSTLRSNSSKLILDCEAINVMNWIDLQILRLHNDNYQVIAMVTSGFKVPSVSMFDPNFSSQISYKEDALAFVLESDREYCSTDKNYTCIIRTPLKTHTKHVHVQVKHYRPRISIPKAIVEGKNITVECSASLYGINGSIKWKFRPPRAKRFFDLNINPTTTQGQANCSTTFNSTLFFLPRNADNGSVIRCEVVGAEDELSEPLLAEVTLLVVPSNYCNSRRLYTVHSHPYSPCNLVVYCFPTGPLVYEINCDPGTCYDKDRTRCISKDEISS